MLRRSSLPFAALLLIAIAPTAAPPIRPPSRCRPTGMSRSPRRVSPGIRW